MRKLGVFVLSFPLLLFALLWVPIGAAFSVAMIPIWGWLCLIDLLRGRDPLWSIFLLPLFIGFDMYFETTGFCPQLAHLIDEL